ncbi:MAG TPA: DUF4186 domain-containing protein [Gammaproteobacteria bacterium]|nr:DUF4186 domain-containing protein [Gammaproteobacteria bacterium]
MRDQDELFRALSRSGFRRRFALRERERGYAVERGLEMLMQHAGRFVEQRLAPAAPANDGRQTPMGRHPVFVAQHATATCCRRCLARWHGIPAGRALTDAEKVHVLAVIRRWLVAQGVVTQ